METKPNKNLKLRFSKMLSSFSSCNSNSIISQAINHDQTPLLNEPLISPKSKPITNNYPSLCRPKCPSSFDAMIRDACHLPIDNFHPLPRRKVSSPVSPVLGGSETGKKERRRRRRKKKRARSRTQLKKGEKTGSFRLISSSNDEDWFSSDDEREEEPKGQDPLFLSSSFSSHSFSFLSSGDDSDTNLPQTLVPNQRYKSISRLERSKSGEIGSFAVVKSSSDPYNDFRTSMVEMIVERQMFGAKELERLLQCFLRLNERKHHEVIVEVFAEILETMFPSKK